MAGTVHESTFHYPFQSALHRGDGRKTLRLATFQEAKSESPFFFDGRLQQPKRTAELLRALMTVVRSRFHVPAAMLNRILAESDPVVTANDDRLRFEGFSACCGAYARLDLLPDSFDGDVCGRGTTNVDFNQPMLAALARIKPTDDVSLAVGANAVVLRKLDCEVKEKKVKLPVRWMKGFVEVQTVQSRMTHRHQISGVHAMKFLRSLPRMKTHRRATFVVKAGAGLKLSQVESNNGVRVGGLERLKILESLIRDAEQLDVFSDDVTGASAWVLTFTDCRFCLVISPEVWRGFSGEGQALQELAKPDQAAIRKVRTRLKWQAVVDAQALAQSAKLSVEKVRSCLGNLGSQGLVGFDLAEAAYFHREMPFDISQVAKLQPRLIAAQKLIAADGIQLQKKLKTKAVFEAQGSGVVHRVELSSQTDLAFKCTCPWFNKHGMQRGPCKHVLAAQIVLEDA